MALITVKGVWNRLLTLYGVRETEHKHREREQFKEYLRGTLIWKVITCINLLQYNTSTSIFITFSLLWLLFKNEFVCFCLSNMIERWRGKHILVSVAEHNYWSLWKWNDWLENIVVKQKWTGSNCCTADFDFSFFKGNTYHAAIQRIPFQKRLLKMYSNITEHRGGPLTDWQSFFRAEQKCRP